MEIHASTAPAVLEDGWTSIAIIVAMIIISGLFALKMVYDHRMKLAFLASSVLFVMVYLLLAMLAWQDSANCLSAFVVTGNWEVPTWGRLPNIVFNLPLLLALLFAVLAFVVSMRERKFARWERDS